MLLEQLLEKLNYELINGSIENQVNELVFDSRNVQKDDVFVCIKGAVSDGHRYIKDVANKGAAAIIVQDDIEITKELNDITIVKIEDTRKALAYMSAAFFGYPANELFTVGITGTKGKTTTTYMVREILEASGIKTGLIGTIQTIIGDEIIPSKNTTPESYMVQKYFRKMVDKGIKCVVMEVSSQALMLHRTAGIDFDLGVFTNLEPDHIGPNEHSSFENYAECKAILFKQCKTGIFNCDSEHFETMKKGHTCKLSTYGINSDADIKAENIKYHRRDGVIYTEFDVKGSKLGHVVLKLPGEFSVYNALCAISITEHFNLDKDKVLQALLDAQVPGRVEIVPVSDDFTVMIDYAHNAMSLKSILSTVKEYEPKRIVTIFGCGGNRSRDRRFDMGEISGKMSDFTIVTSDNPRDEEPMNIMKDIETGINKTGGRYILIEDRQEAVRYGILNAQEGDIIIVAGKGHEDYQEIKGIRYHMTDRELIENAAKELKN